MKSTRIEPFARHHRRYDDWFERHRSAYLSELLAVRALLPWDGRGLEIGVGTGRFAAPLGVEFGIDPAGEMLEYARDRGIRVVRAVAEALPFGPAAFDLVTSFDVLYHRWVTDDRAAVCELARVLAPGGLLLVRVPALKMLWGAHDDAVLSRHRYTRGEVETLLRGAGLDVLELTYANTLLFPVLALRRALDRLTGRHGSDVSFLPAPVEAAFLGLLRAEARLVRHLRLPIGASVLALARKPRGAGTIAP